MYDNDLRYNKKYFLIFCCFRLVANMNFDFNTWESLWRVPHFKNRYQHLMRQQAVVNIAFIGSVAHGKTTLVEKLSSIDTRRYAVESKKGYSVKIGYANFLLYGCPKCESPYCFQSRRFPEKNEKDRLCSIHQDTEMELLSHFSVIDCPGHSALSSVMMSGAGCVDGAILVIAANESCPQSQTQEHLAVADLAGLEIIAVVQNKMDLCNDYVGHYDQIKEFVQGTVAEPANIIPSICRPDITKGVNEVCQELARFALHHTIQKASELLVGQIELNPLRMLLVRSFDFNKPGLDDSSQLIGGGLGGPIVSGEMKIGMIYEARPGRIVAENNEKRFMPLVFRIDTLKTPKSVNYAVKGGNIGVGTSLDPSLTRNDGMAGQIVGTVGTLPNVYGIIEGRYFVMKGKKLQEGDLVRITISTQTSDGVVKKTKKDKKIRKLLVMLKRPVCCEPNEPFSIMTKDESGTFHLIAKGEVLDSSNPLKISDEFDKIISSISDEKLRDTKSVFESEEFDEPKLITIESQWGSWVDQSDDWDLIDYTELLKNATGQNVAINTAKNEKIRIDNPIIERDGGAHVIWSNYQSVCRAINRPIDHFINFMKTETLMDMTIRETGLRVRGRINSSQIGRIIQKYMIQYVKCKYCGSRNTEFTDHRMNFIKCNDCHSRQWEVTQLK